MIKPLFLYIELVYIELGQIWASNDTVGPAFECYCIETAFCQRCHWTIANIPRYSIDGDHVLPADICGSRAQFHSCHQCLYLRYWYSSPDQLIITTRVQRFHSHYGYCRVQMCGKKTFFQNDGLTECKRT